MEYKGGAGDGSRQRMLESQRKKQEEEIKKKKEQIIKDNTVQVGKVDERFTTQHDDFATALAKDTIGLVTLSEFERKKRTLDEKRAAELAATRPLAELIPDRKKRKKEEKKLTFSFEEEEQEGNEGLESKEGSVEKGENGEANDEQNEGFVKKIGKNPFVDTSFLPDREREAEEQAERERLAAEWREKQEAIKQQEVEIIFSYWDGSGHRSSVTCKKGDTIGQFLEKAKQQFHELRGVNVENLMYVKEDIIIPSHHTFYEFIVNKSRGKSGGLFNFGVHEDVRLMADARVEKEESHAGKVVERRWYERNKHIFPASRWENYDPQKTYGQYTISDRNKR